MCFIGFGCKTKVAHCCMVFASWLHMLVIVLCRSIWISEPSCRPANPHNFPRGLAFFLALSLLPLRVTILSIYDNLSHFFPPPLSNRNLFPAVRGVQSDVLLRLGERKEKEYSNAFLRRPGEKNPCLLSEVLREEGVKWTNGVYARGRINLQCFLRVNFKIICRKKTKHYFVIFIL